MKTVRNSIYLMFAVVSVLWFMSEPQLLSSTQFFYWRSALIQYSGVVALALMSIAMVLALRLPVIEKWVKGMDKAYRVHKWLGISGVSLGIVHWLLYQVPNWLVEFEVLEKPLKHSGEGPSGYNLTTLETWIVDLRDVGLSLGEWGFYLLVVLFGMSLWTVVKYKPFKVSHRMMAAVYLMIAVHSVLLIKRAYWGEPIFYVSIAFAFIGSAAAIYSLSGLVGRTNRHNMKVKLTRFFPQARVMELVLTPTDSWQGHKAGQFAYVRFGDEDPHPFTIASANSEPELRFLIKELGDFTTGLCERVKVGDEVTLEGPYGRLEFDVTKPQVWVAGGVGIAVFVAILASLKQRKSHQPVHLFYCTRGLDSHLVDDLWRYAQHANVELSVIDTQVSPRLNAQRIVKQCGNLAGYELYFCGPEVFSNALKQQLIEYRFDTEHHYHEELFVMR
ncbi:ferric reductase-like transmembrane domain-containing protein [Vibrio sp. J1-1]|uniref:ferredoxin reductase family protein n=1 Tax=Vibrio sp. J1-1 TaxID=2912251 RepID=UPI001F44C8ED|nr:ferric reductase-like transmembrane domain-containing protein [Vibrio sp. J1-1]MBR9872845.1 ferric reductase [Vibrionaceae bacterium]MCF7480225.1 ferric reductase-like transmembrane domain-containing protein [Vibrio sp. J1-1]